MRDLRENQQEVSFRTVTSQTAILDEYGNETGSYNPVYGDIQTDKLCIAPARGRKNHEMFGSLIDYDRVATASDPDCKIGEDSILWLDGKSTDEPYNYIVMRKATWKNSVSYALREVKVSDA